MTRWAIVADLNRCVGCQTCTSSCKHTNATAPGVQWRKVLDFEAGEYPDVTRAFLPVGCMHCDEPPCLDVCPSTATSKRDDGIVSIDYDLCIGCAYCAVACPYQARARVDKPNAAYGGKPMPHEMLSEHPDRRGVAQKCTFCIDKIDLGLANGLTPGSDPEATPACVNSCIADALYFGDTDNPDSKVSILLRQNKHFRMHEDLGTGPGIHYLWEHGDNAGAAVEPAFMVADPTGMSGVSPQLQKNWDWRAAANFIFGGAGTGLFLAAAIAGFLAAPLWQAALLAMALVAAGLFFVWLEIGRPLRFANVYFNAKLSWMTREALSAPLFFALGAASLFSASPVIWLAAAGCGLIFLFCQGKILQAAKGIPAWRQDQIVALIVSTGLAEGFGLFAVFAVFSGFDKSLLQIVTVLLLALVTARYFFWRQYRSALGRQGAPTQTFRVLDSGIINLSFGTQLITAAIAVMSLMAPVLLVFGGLLTVLTGWSFKHTLITRAAFNQGYEIGRMPARGAGNSAPGIKPGWMVS